MCDNEIEQRTMWSNKKNYKRQNAYLLSSTLTSAPGDCISLGKGLFMYIIIYIIF